MSGPGTSRGDRRQVRRPDAETLFRPLSIFALISRTCDPCARPPCSCLCSTYVHFGANLRGCCCFAAGGRRLRRSAAPKVMAHQECVNFAVRSATAVAASGLGAPVGATMTKRAHQRSDLGLSGKLPAGLPRGESLPVDRHNFHEPATRCYDAALGARRSRTSTRPT